MELLTLSPFKFEDVTMKKLQEDIKRRKGRVARIQDIIETNTENMNNPNEPRYKKKRRWLQNKVWYRTDSTGVSYAEKQLDKKNDELVRAETNFHQQRSYRTMMQESTKEKNGFICKPGRGTNINTTNESFEKNRLGIHTIGKMTIDESHQIEWVVWAVARGSISPTRYKFVSSDDQPSSVLEQIRTEEKLTLAQKCRLLSYYVSELVNHTLHTHGSLRGVI